MRVNVFITFILAAFFFISHPAHAADTANDTSEGVISVTGTASAYHSPDTATIVLTVETTAKSVTEAKKTNAGKTDAVVNAVKSRIKKEAGDSVKTSHYSVQPVYDYDTVQKKNRLTGYRVTNQITIRTKDINLPGTLIDSAIESGANRVDNVNFSLENTERYCKDILIKAVDKTKREAEIVATALGVKIAGVKSAASNCAVRGIQPIYRFEAAMAKSADAVVTPVEAGDVEILGTVNTSFLLSK